MRFQTDALEHMTIAAPYVHLVDRKTVWRVFMRENKFSELWQLSLLVNVLCKV
jgi:hypothetical protein